MTHFTKVWLRDAAERTIATYVQAFLGLLIAGGTVMDISTVTAAAVAAIPAALAVLKSLVGKRIPGSISPASVL